MTKEGRVPYTKESHDDRDIVPQRRVEEVLIDRCRTIKEFSEDAEAVLNGKRADTNLTNRAARTVHFGLQSK